MALFSLIFTLFHNPFMVGIILGYLFHILGDFFSRSGVPLLLPINKKRYKFLLTYKTLSYAETVIFYVATVRKHVDIRRHDARARTEHPLRFALKDFHFHIKGYTSRSYHSTKRVTSEEQELLP